MKKTLIYVTLFVLIVLIGWIIYDTMKIPT